RFPSARALAAAGDRPALARSTRDRPRPRRARGPDHAPQPAAGAVRPRSGHVAEEQVRAGGEARAAHRRRVVRTERVRAHDRHAERTDADARARARVDLVTAYFVATAVLLAGLAPLLVFSGRAELPDGLVALDLGGTIATLVLLLFAEATRR